MRKHPKSAIAQTDDFLRSNYKFSVSCFNLPTQKSHTRQKTKKNENSDTKDEKDRSATEMEENRNDRQ